jgi:predicted CoA-substrate-specific enzyme activase
VGIDAGAETLKVVLLEREGERLAWRRRLLIEHGKEPGQELADALATWGVEAAAELACGRLSRSLGRPRVPEGEARAAGFRFLAGDAPATLVSIGSHGVQALELRAGGRAVPRESPRCSQGTGNFLRQLVARFGLDVEAADVLAAAAANAAALSGRCPVILKTDMTHLANAGHDRGRVLAGLFDAVAESAEALVRPRVGPPRVALCGGVARSRRVRAHFAAFLERHGLQPLELDPADAPFLEALGCALLAAREGGPGRRAVDTAPPRLDPLPPLADALTRVRRLPAPPLPAPAQRPRARIVLGLDVGSTGTKAAAVDAADGTLLWHAYTATAGDPVGAAQRLVGEFVADPWGAAPVAAVGATGSGREVVGPLLSACFGPDRLLVLNEIAAHSAGALRLEPRVDTIFEIGGQDAKYVRLEDGRVVESAMNEACSAGTGSFIEEQGRLFTGVAHVSELGPIALSAPHGVSLGQHCSVFMAEILDEAAASGAPREAIVAGLYDSVVQNYLNRVKGQRPVGAVVFCQGMPFASDALAAAVARSTGGEVVVPPYPGAMGAFGIALLTLRERPQIAASGPALGLDRFLAARVAGRSEFQCESSAGCGGNGQRCRIERLETEVNGTRQRLVWGGACALHERGSGGRVRLPDDAPDAFRERELLVERALAGRTPPRDPRRVAMADEFALRGLLPFFATFFAELGLEVEVARGGRPALRRGVEEATVPFCAPMQLYHGLVGELALRRPDFLFLPMLVEMPPARDETRSVLCPIVTGSADILRTSLAARHDRSGPAVLSPVLVMAVDGLRATSVRRELRAVARELGLPARRSDAALAQAIAAQERFDTECRAIGERVLGYAAGHHLPVVVVLGRPYTIHNRALDAHVPAILREQGALAVPADCYPTSDDAPVLRSVFWSSGQRLLRAAHDVRQARDQYGLWCSNYACGPDSFLLHLFADLMRGKPWAVIETDGHAGDAGTRTRVEAFLQCVSEDRRAQARSAPPPRALTRFDDGALPLQALHREGRVVLLPRLGPGTEALAACLRGLGVAAECLGVPDRHVLEAGRRHTTGKECLPLALTLGSVLRRVERADPAERFAILMPVARGPCRAGMYHTVDRMVFERLGLESRVRLWSPSDAGYFEGAPAGLAALVFSGVMAAELLEEMRCDALAGAPDPAAVRAAHERRRRELVALLEHAAGGDVGARHALAEVARGRLFGCGPFLREAARELASLRDPRPRPGVLVVGEIYVRLDPFATSHVVERLLERGIRARVEPVHAWLEYQDHINALVGIPRDAATRFSAFVQGRIQARAWNLVRGPFGWPAPPSAAAELHAAAPFVRHQLEGEPGLTLGGALLASRSGDVDGVLSLAPLECLASRVAEAQFPYAAPADDMHVLCLQLNGDPIDPEALDAFLYEVEARFARRAATSS